MDRSRPRRSNISKLKYKTGFASKKQIGFSAGEYDHSEKDEHNNIWEVYRMPDGRMLKSNKFSTSSFSIPHKTKEEREISKNKNLSDLEKMKLKLEANLISQEVFDTWYKRYSNSHPEDVNLK